MVSVPATSSRLSHGLDRAVEFSGRAGRRGMREQRNRVQAWRSRLWLICQCSFSAAFAWFLCQRIIGHDMPFFGPVAAVICLGLSFGQRLTRALEVCVGVAVGIFVGELFVHFFGQGIWQIALVCFLAMSIATWLGARNLMIIQSGLQSITVLLMFPVAAQGVSRWLDALVGCALALVVTTIAPSSTVWRPRVMAAGILADMATTLRASQHAADSGDEDGAYEALIDARAASTRLDKLRDAADEGMAVVRYSPFYRRHREMQQALVDLIRPLDRVIRDMRVLSRRARTAAWRGEDIPDDVLGIMDSLADILDFCAGELYARRLPTAAIPRLEVLARRTAHTSIGDSLSAAVILGQVRFIVVDLLELCGLQHEEARDRMPGAELE